MRCADLAAVLGELAVATAGAAAGDGTPGLSRREDAESGPAESPHGLTA